MSAVYRPISISKDFWLVSSMLTLAIHIFFKPRHSKFLFSHKNCYLVQLFQYMSYSYLVLLYFHGNHTIFSEKNHTLYINVPLATLL